MKLAIDYVGRPNSLLLDLADIARERGNERLRRIWLRNYFRRSDEMKRRVAV
ncbi:hypothetical protein [Paenibacillus pinihumi]|uniref:hypothetical protein n=1 Tax=Paenibacillus pinihumi TaxID=669462 RepID=UPI000A94658A|nr:hypothetical protein [Paenibacillus pinihumi]